MKMVLLKSACMGLLMIFVGCSSTPSEGDVKKGSQAGLTRDAKVALQELCANVQVAKLLHPTVKAILIFPDVYRAGLIIGGQSGNGVAMTPDGHIVDYLNITSASYGMQAGAQKYSYALFVMSDAAIEYIKKTRGWEVGTGPTVVLVDQGFASMTTTTTLNKDIYAFIFNQQGIMGAVGLIGSKITRINPEP